MGIEEKRLRAKRIKAELMKSQVFSAESGIDTSPLPYPKQDDLDRLQTLQKSFVPDSNDLEAQRYSREIQRDFNTLQQEKSLTDSGVDITTGGGAGRFGAGFALNDDLMQIYIRDAFKKKYGEETRVRRTPQGTQYLNPETNRWTMLDESGLSVNDVMDAVGPAIPLAGDIIGGVGGAGLGLSGGPGGVAAGATLGAGAVSAAGEAIKLQIGEWLGVNPDLTFGELASESLSTGVEAAAGAGASEVITRGGGRLLRGPRGMSPREAAALEREAADSNIVVDEINARQDINFNPNMAQRSGNEAALDEFETIKRSQGKTEINEALREEQRGNRAALEQFFVQASPDGRPSQLATGKGIGDRFKVEKEAALGDARAIERSTIDAVQADAGDIVNLDFSSGGETLRLGFLQARKAAESIEKKAWNNVDRLAGYDELTASSKIKIPRGDNINNSLRALSAESRKALIESQAKGKKSLISRLVKQEGDEIQILDQNGKILSSISRSGEDIDLKQLNDTISHLRRQIRVSSKGLTTTDPSTADAKRLLKSLVKDRNDFLKQNNPEVLNSIRVAERASRDKNRIFERGIVADYLKETQDGQWVVSDPDVFNSIIRKRNGQAAKELSEILKLYPSAMQKTREQIHALYKAQVFEDGIPTREAHNKFINEYGDTIAPFFTKGDFQKVQKFGRMADVIKRRADDVERLETALSKRLPGKIAKLNDESIIESLFGRGKTESGATTLNVRDAKQLRMILESSDKSLLENAQASIREEISRRARKGGALNSEALGEVIELYGDKISIMISNQYKKDLQTLAEGLKLIERKGIPFNEGAQPTLLQFTRAILGPLNKRQRLITAGRNVKAGSVEAAYLEIMLDENKMRALASLMNKPITSNEVIALFASVESADLLEDFNFEDQDGN